METTPPPIHVASSGRAVLKSKCVTGPRSLLDREMQVPEGVEHAVVRGANTTLCGISTWGYDLWLWPGLDFMTGLARRCPTCTQAAAQAS